MEIGNLGERNSIIIDGRKIIETSNTKILTAYTSLQSNYDSFVDSDGVKYSVPALKKFLIKGFYANTDWATPAVIKLELGSSTASVTDSTIPAGFVKLEQAGHQYHFSATQLGDGNNQDNNYSAFTVEKNVATTLFITAHNIVGMNQGFWVLVGEEVDA